MQSEQTPSVARGFSSLAQEYDELDLENGIIQWKRAVVRSEIERFLQPGDRMMEWNCGAGPDAVYFAGKGHSVLALDIAPGMLAALEQKVKDKNLEEHLQWKQRSFTDPPGSEEGKFRYVYSNFGGLNCLRDLSEALRHLPQILEPGGFVSLVIMPPVAPWELVLALKGKFSYAFRRLKRGGTPARLNNETIMVYYHTPADIRKAAGPEFTQVGLRNLSLFMPPSDHASFPRNFPGLFTFTKGLEENAARLPFLRLIGDYIIVTLQYQP